jgi:hypothetical protein
MVTKFEAKALGLGASKKGWRDVIADLPKDRDGALALALSTLEAIRHDEIKSYWWYPKSRMIRLVTGDILDALKKEFGAYL